MNEKEMAKHIRELTKIIKKQNEYSEQLSRNFTSINRQITNIYLRVAKLEECKNE